MCIAPWHWNQGTAGMTEKLKEQKYRTEVRKEMESASTPYDNYYRNSGGWEGVFVTIAKETPEAEGKYISQYAEEVGTDPWTAYFDLMVKNECVAFGVYSSMCEEDVCTIIKDPYCVVGTDGYTPNWESKGHPRTSSTFPHAICHFVKEKKILTLEQMIHKMTGLPADRLLVTNKGLLKAGYDADVLILDYDNLRDLATYENPNQKAEGIDYVFVNGQIVYHNMEFTGICSGQVVRHGGR